MKLEFLPLDKLHRSRANMRFARKVPDVSDILPSVRARGVLMPIIVRAEPFGDGADGYGVVAGDRRYTAASIVAEEVRAGGGDPEPMPCAIIDEGDDAAALEASMIENMARLDPDEVGRWESFTRLVRQGRSVEEIAATFGLPDLAVKRTLALGNLLPRIRSLYRAGEIGAATVRHLTLASRAQQTGWLALVDDPDASIPTGQRLKAWLFGGQSIATKHALFDIEGSGLVTVSDLFGEDRFFADAAAFWIAQDAAIEALREGFLAAAWADAVIVPATTHFSTWEYDKTPKRKGGRVYIDVRSSGEVVVHEGYLTRREAERLARGERPGEVERPVRPEVSTTMQAYVDLHRHAAVRAELAAVPSLALRMLVAHMLGGSALWRIDVDPRRAPNAGVAESTEAASAEAAFDGYRRAALAALGLDDDEPTLVGRAAHGIGVAELFHRLIALPDATVLEIVAVAMGETLAVGSSAVEAAGRTLGTDMADWWGADDAFFDSLRDREVIAAIVAEVAGETIAKANAREMGKTLKAIVRAHLDGADGRIRVEHWVPRWMRFAPSAYTDRGGVGTVRVAQALRAADDDDHARDDHAGVRPAGPQGAASAPPPPSILLPIAA